MQGNENEVEVNIPTNPFGIPGEWRPLVFPEDEAALDEDANTTEPVKESSQLTIASPLPVNKNTSGVFTFGELMASSIERPKAIVEGLIYERQNSLLMGRFGVGKTMFGVQLSLHLATGREFLGLKVPRQCPTLYLDFENDLGDMKNRLSKQRAGMTLTPEEETQLNKHWCYADAGDLESPLHHLKLDATGQVSESLTKLLIQNKAEVLIIDNLGLVATKGDLKEPEDATRFYANLNSIRSKVATLRDGAIIVFHHLTKPSDQGGASPISLLKSPYE